MEVLEGLQLQTVIEEVPYRIKATPAAVDVLAITVVDVTVDEDVTDTVMPDVASASVDAGDIVLTVLKSLEANHTYQVRVLYSVAGGAKLEALIKVRCA